MEYRGSLVKTEGFLGSKATKPLQQNNTHGSPDGMPQGRVPLHAGQKTRKQGSVQRVTGPS